jgi:hypothetical protein
MARAMPCSEKLAATRPAEEKPLKNDLRVNINPLLGTDYFGWPSKGRCCRLGPIGEAAMVTQEPPTETSQPLTLAQRRRQMAEQAERMAAHYESDDETRERDEWQTGDTIEPF